MSASLLMSNAFYRFQQAVARSPHTMAQMDLLVSHVVHMLHNIITGLQILHQLLITHTPPSAGQLQVRASVCVCVRVCVCARVHVCGIEELSIFSSR